MKSFDYYKNKKCKNLLIHGNDIVLIDKVVECGKDYIIVDAVINEKILFLDMYQDKKIFQTYKCIEMMAQSLGCYQYINISVNNGSEKAKIGFLLGARKFDIYIPYIECGQKLLIETKISIQNNDGFGVYDSTIYFDKIDDNKKVAQATLSVLSPTDDFIEGIQNNIEGYNE